MLRPKGYLTFILFISLAFFLLSSSIVSSFRIDSSDALATSEVEGEESGNLEAEQQEEGQAPEEDQQEGEEQQEDSNFQDPVSGDVPLVDETLVDQPPEGNQLVRCSGVVNPETGECEEVRVEGGSPEICDNSVDDNLDGNIDEGDCLPEEEQRMDASGVIPPSFAPDLSAGQTGEWSLPQGTDAGGPADTNAFPDPSSGESSDWGLPQLDDDLDSVEGTESPSFSSSPSPSDSSVPSFSAPVDSGIEATESLNREGIMPSPSDPQTPPPTYTGPSDLIASPSTDDPDFCLKEFGRQQITGGKPSPQCMPGQSTGTPSPNTDPQSQQQPQQQSQQLAASEPPAEQPNDPDPVDLAQLCDSLTLQALIDVDCGQYQPGGLEPAAGPTDQPTTDEPTTDQPPQDQRSVIFTPPTDEEPPVVMLRPTDRLITTATQDRPDTDDDPIAAIQGFLVGTVEGFLPFGTSIGEFIFDPAATNPKYAAGRSNGQAAGTLLSLPNLFKSLTSLPKIAKQIGNLAKGAEGGVRLSGAGVAAIEGTTDLKKTAIALKKGFDNTFQVSGTAWNIAKTGDNMMKMGWNQKLTEPTLPPKTIAKGGGAKIEHYYRSGDHMPAHLHIKQGKLEVKIGSTGKPEGVLSPAQQALFDNNIGKIEKALDKITQFIKYHRPETFKKNPFPNAISDAEWDKLRDAFLTGKGRTDSNVP